MNVNRRKCQSCDSAFRLFIGDACEESLLLPDTDTAHKIIWAFQGLETGTAFVNIWTTISMSGSRRLDEISRVYPQHWVARFAHMLHKWYSRCCHDCIYVRTDTRHAGLKENICLIADRSLAESQLTVSFKKYFSCYGRPTALYSWNPA